MAVVFEITNAIKSTEFKMALLHHTSVLNGVWQGGHGVWGAQGSHRIKKESNTNRKRSAPLLRRAKYSI